MAEQIFHLTESGNLEPMNEKPFDLEDRLQELVANHPDLLSGEQMSPDNPRRFILIDREQGIADKIGGTNRWSVDHLLIDQDAIPTLVEAKLGKNPEIRREIVGQMMDYAAHVTHTWNAADIRRTFEERIKDAGQDPGEILVNFLGGEEPDVEKFWQDVETNLRAAKMRLLFVADGIPDELTRVVEFLNEQMPGIEVLAVEVKQFKGDTGSTLVPRVIGRTAEAVAASSRRSSTRQDGHFSLQTLIESFPDEQTQERVAIERLFEVARRSRARFNWSNNGASIRATCPAFRRQSIGWIYAPGQEGFMGVGGVVFGAGNGLHGFFDELPPDLTEVLNNWVNEFAQDEFAVKVEQTGIRAWQMTHQAAADNIDLICERLDRVLKELSELQPAAE